MPVKTVYFLEAKSLNRIGFVGLGEVSPNNGGQLWKTTDAGVTWKQIPDITGMVFAIIFKDSSTGWLTSFSPSGCYKTTDAGETWFKVLNIFTPVGLHYHPFTQLLFVNDWSDITKVSADLGVTWSNSTPSFCNGITFSNNYLGWSSAYLHNVNQSYVTRDGGFTWAPSTPNAEIWQPTAIPKSTILIGVSEISGDIFRSDDGANTWNTIYNLSPTNPTGCMVVGTCNKLLIQSGLKSVNGIMVSIDTGLTWKSIGGPNNIADTRFCTTGKFVYAGTLIGTPSQQGNTGELWRYEFQDTTEPVFDANKYIFNGQTCNISDSTITISISSICAVDSISITSLRLSNVNSFAVTYPALFPFRLSGYDSLGVRYSPKVKGEDTAYLTINFYRDGETFDTIITLIGHADINNNSILSSFTPDTVYSNTISCTNDSEVIHFRVQDTCRNLFATATNGNISGSAAFVLLPQLPKQSTGEDSLIVTFTPLRFGLDTSLLHVTFELDGVNVDTTFILIGEYRPSKISLAPTVSDTSLSVTSSNCIGASGHIYYSVFDSCLGTKGELVSATVTGSINFQVTADADSATVIYNGAGYDTAKLALKFRLYEYEYDTVITLYGYPSAMKDSLSFLATLTKPSVTWEETTELRVLPDRVAANKNLSEIRFDVTLDADVLEPLTNYSTGIAGAAIMMGSPTPIGKLMRFPFTITGNNMTLDPAVNILNLPMRPYVSDTTMTTIEVSTIRLNPQDGDYERCTLSATGNGTPFRLELMCGDSTLSRYLGGKPILTITSLKPNPTKSDVTVTFDLAGSGALQAEVLDVLGNVVKQETLEATQGETKYIISLPDAPEGVYYVRLRYGTQTRTAKFVRE